MSGWEFVVGCGVLGLALLLGLSEIANELGRAGWLIRDELRDIRRILETRK